MARSRRPSGVAVSGAASRPPPGPAEGLGHARRLARGLQAQRGIGLRALLAQGPVEIAPQHVRRRLAEVARLASWRAGEIVAQLGLPALVQRQALPGQPGCEQAWVAPVGGQGVARQAVFEPERVDEGVDGLLAGWRGQESRRLDMVEAGGRRTPCHGRRAKSPRPGVPGGPVAGTAPASVQAQLLLRTTACRPRTRP
jgi:hypothetical protein